MDEFQFPKHQDLTPFYASVQQRSNEQNDFLSVLNTAVMPKVFDRQGISIKSVTFTSYIHGRKYYLVDWPFKWYYPTLNEWLKKNKLDILTSAHFAGKVDTAWLFFRYSFGRLGNAIYVSSITRTQLSPSIAEVLRLSPLDKKRQKKLALLFHLMAFDDRFVSKEPINLLIVSQRTDIGRELGALTVVLQLEDTREVIEYLAYTTVKVVFPLILGRLEGVISHVLFLQEALRSSIAAIMARNMSHNIDSHITPRATVEAVRDRLKGLGFAEDLDVIQLLKGRLDEYRQERADFLAEITSEPLTTTKPILFYRGVILPLIENTLFMDNIARNEGICYRDQTNNRLRIRVFVEDTELKVDYKCATSQGSNNTQPYSITYPDQGFPYTAHCIGCNYQSETEDHTIKPSELVGIPQQPQDIEIELPGPVGEHAFYGFLENFIRNAAKHNRQHFDANPNENLEINIRISEPTDEQEKREFYVIEIWDNVTNPNASVEVKVDGKPCETLVELIKAYIESDVIDETGKKKEQAYGITEMKVDATLLRGSTDFMRMKEFLEVCEEKRKATQWSNGHYEEVEKERLIYRFRLMKAKKMCGVFPNWTDEALRKTLQDQGIWIFKTVEELKQAVMPGEKSGKDVPKSAASFRFAVFDCSGENGQEIANNIPDLLPFLPFRILVLKGNNTIKGLPKSVVEVNELGSNFPQDSNNIMVWLWTRWLQRWGNDLKILEIYLDQNSKDSPTTEWTSHANNFNQYCVNNNLPYRVRVWSRDGDTPCAGDVNWNGTHIVFDRHGGMRFRPSNNPIANRAYFNCELGKLSPDFVYIFKPQFPQGGQVWTIPFELLESGLMRILVIDERVAEKSREKVGGIPRWNMCFNGKVYICTHLIINTETIALHKSVENGMPYLKLKFSNKSLSYETHAPKNFPVDGVDMVIIHQGVLDNLKEHADAFLQALQKHINFVIVDSGRGIPSTLPPKIKFLPFSVLNDYLLGQALAKYRLTQVCMSLTRKKEA